MLRWRRIEEGGPQASIGFQKSGTVITGTEQASFALATVGLKTRNLSEHFFFKNLLQFRKRVYAIIQAVQQHQQANAESQSGHAPDHQLPPESGPVTESWGSVFHDGDAFWINLFVHIECLHGGKQPFVQCFNPVGIGLELLVFGILPAELQGPAVPSFHVFFEAGNLQRQRVFSVFQLIGALLAKNGQEPLAPGYFLLHGYHARMFRAQVLAEVLQLGFKHRNLAAGSEEIPVGGIGTGFDRVGFAWEGKGGVGLPALEQLLEGQSLE